jgi:hypothetical protein
LLCGYHVSFTKELVNHIIYQTSEGGRKVVFWCNFKQPIAVCILQALPSRNSKEDMKSGFILPAETCSRPLGRWRVGIKYNNLKIGLGEEKLKRKWKWASLIKCN